MADDGFIPLRANADFHWLSEGLNADERDLRRETLRRTLERGSRGNVRLTPGERVQADSLAWHGAHPLNA